MPIPACPAMLDMTCLLFAKLLSTEKPCFKTVMNQARVERGEKNRGDPVAAILPGNHSL